MDANDPNVAVPPEGQSAVATGPVTGSQETKGDLPKKPLPANQPVRGSVDVRLPCERPKSKKLNRTTSFQCYVDLEGWLQSFPELTIADLGPGLSSDCFQNSDGLKIATYAWRQPSSPRAAIVLFHSYTSYTLFDFLRHQPHGEANQQAKEEAEDWLPKYPGD